MPISNAFINFFSVYLKPPPKSKCLGVFGLSANTTEDKIYDIFSKYGKIKRINVIFDTKVNRFLQSSAS